MSKTLTIKNFTELVEIGYDGKANTEVDIQSLALLSDVKVDKLKKMTPNKYSEFKANLLSQVIPGKPVYLIKYKGKIYGYCPPEIDTVEAMIAVELFMQQKNWNALAALMFREANTITKWWWSSDKHYVNRDGVKVKEIDNFPKNKITYKCKSVDFSNLDLDYWDDLPANILLSNLAFSIGSGVRSSLNTPSSSYHSKVLIKKAEELQVKIQLLITSSLLQNTALGLECLNYTENSQSSIAHQENYSIGWYTSTSKLLKKQIKDLVWVLSGENKSNTIEALIGSVNNIVNKNLTSDDVSVLSAIGNVNNREAKIGLLWQR